MRKFLGIAGFSLLTNTLLLTAQVEAQIVAAPNDSNTTVNNIGDRFNITGGTQSGANLFHSFQKFGLNSQQIANFISNPNIQNILSRVVGGEASIINGLIQVTGSNANLYLMNPAGILFGANARLDVPGAFTATTANGIGFGNNKWFSASGTNDYTALTANPGNFAFTISQPGVIFNAGNLEVGVGESLNLLANTVINTGKLSAPGGNITIAAIPGEKLVSISQTGNLLSLALPIEIANQINPIPFNPLSLPQLLTEGKITNAAGVNVENGIVKLTKSGIQIPQNPGTAIVSNTVDVSGTKGGTVNIFGDRVGVISANINASGNNGGGTVLIGGDYQGQGTLPNAKHTYFSQDSVVKADALTNGNGGKVVVWADETTSFYGKISARGGIKVSDGGFVEVSGKKNLVFRGDADTSAVNGSFGNLLLDPTDLTISAGTGDGGTDGSDTFKGASNIGEVLRARAFVELLAGRLEKNTTSALSIEKIRTLARQQNATLIEYSIIPDDDFKFQGKQRGKESELLIWVVTPAGKVTLRHVDLKALWTDKLTLTKLVEASRCLEKSLFCNRQAQAIAQALGKEPNIKYIGLRKLHKILIEPIADLLPKDAKARIIFIPQESLFLVPFAALQDSENKYFISQYTILTAPAIQILDLTEQQKNRLTQQNRKSLKPLIIGNPTMPKISLKPGEEPKQLEQLPQAEREAGEVAKILKHKAIIGAEATKIKIKQLLPQANLIHFATHGLLEYRSQKSSSSLQGLEVPGALALTPTNTDDGLLTSGEIFDQKLVADLVVLSACDTGRGRITGDGVIGLSRAFITAGTPSIVVSLWSVPDASTADLMIAFYQKLQTEPDKAQALRQAMLTLMKTHSEPLDWSGFTLIGEADAILSKN